MLGLEFLKQPVNTITRLYRERSNLNKVGRILDDTLENLITDKQSLFYEIERWKSDFIKEIEDEAQKAIEQLDDDFEQKRIAIRVKKTECEQSIKENSDPENATKIQAIIDSCKEFNIQLKRLDKIRKEVEFLRILDDTVDAANLLESDNKQDTSILDANERMEVENRRDVEVMQNSVEALLNKLETQESPTEDQIPQTDAGSTWSRSIQAQKEATEKKKVTRIENEHFIVHTEICPVCYMIFQVGTTSEHVNKHTLAHNIY